MDKSEVFLPAPRERPANDWQADGVLDNWIRAGFFGLADMLAVIYHALDALQRRGHSRPPISSLHEWYLEQDGEDGDGQPVHL